MKTVYSTLLLLALPASNFAQIPLRSEQIRFDVIQGIRNRNLQAQFPDPYPAPAFTQAPQSYYQWSNNQAQQQIGNNGETWDKSDYLELRGLLAYLPRNYHRQCAAQNPGVGLHNDDDVQFIFGENGVDDDIIRAAYRKTGTFNPRRIENRKVTLEYHCTVPQNNNDVAHVTFNLVYRETRLG